MKDKMMTLDVFDSMCICEPYPIEIVLMITTNFSYTMNRYIDLTPHVKITTFSVLVDEKLKRQPLRSMTLKVRGLLKTVERLVFVAMYGIVCLQ